MPTPIGCVSRPRQSSATGPASCRARTTTRLARELRFDVEGADLARQSHRDRTARFWSEHFKNNKRRILEAASVMQNRRGKAGARPLVMALGAGSCADIPLRELVARGNDVILVNLDQASLKKGIAMQLAPQDRRHVRIEIRDLSEGAIDAVSQQAASIIARHARDKGGAARARAELIALFKHQRVSVPQLEGAHRVDLLVSSMLMSQLPVFPVKQIGRRFRSTFGKPLVGSPNAAMAQSAFGDKLFDAHMEALGDFVVRRRAVVYFSSDIFLRPSFYDPRAKRGGFGRAAPVVGFRGQPLLDLDVPFEGNPDLQVLSPSASSGRKGSDFWIWNQEPARLAKKVGSIRMRSDTGVVEVKVRKGFVRAIDAVTIVPR